MVYMRESYESSTLQLNKGLNQKTLGEVFFPAFNTMLNPCIDFALYPGNGPGAKLDGLGELPNAHILVDRRPAKSSAAHDVFDADQLHAHVELLLVPHEMRQASIFI